MSSQAEIQYITCWTFLPLDGRGQQLPGVFRGYPLITPKSGTQEPAMGRTVQLHVELHDVSDECKVKVMFSVVYRVGKIKEESSQGCS